MGDNFCLLRLKHSCLIRKKHTHLWTCFPSVLCKFLVSWPRLVQWQKNWKCSNRNKALNFFSRLPKTSCLDLLMISRRIAAPTAVNISRLFISMNVWLNIHCSIQRGVILICVSIETRPACISVTHRGYSSDSEMDSTAGCYAQSVSTGKNGNEHWMFFPGDHRCHCLTLEMTRNLFHLSHYLQTTTSVSSMERRGLAM